MRALPTDRDILNAIYERYYQRFASFTKAAPDRSAKIYVPIDIDELARSMSVDPDIIFGRLYYHLEKKYRYEQEDGSKVHLFRLSLGDDPHCINFPYAASVLADLRREHRQFRIATGIAVLSLVVSIVALVVSLWRSP